ncbi:trypsin-like peptidase domain-containing protein [Cyanobium sp. BA20m-p-22]|nr:trypsin-like peptidase domain-containing protein [Cyanobium sp. BA20m-p-22]
MSAATQQPAAAQSAESVAKVAQVITVRIEGATQGSGVLVKRDGNRYTVLTAWHVVAGQRPGEELAVYTSDARAHAVDSSSIRQINGADLASLTFASDENYAIARLGRGLEINIGSRLYVGGFPLPTSAVPSRLFRFLEGLSIASTSKGSVSGYELLYSNPTLPGMSGGPVMDARGLLVGIHGRAETDSQLTEQQGVAVKTGSNQGIPIDLFQSVENFANSTQVTPQTVNKPISPNVEPLSKEKSEKGGAPQDLINDLTLIAAVNSCELARNEGLEIQKTLTTSAKASTYVVNANYNGIISGAGKLASQQLVNDSLIASTAEVSQGCGSKLNQADLSFIEEIKKPALSAGVAFSPASRFRKSSMAPIVRMNDLALAAAVNVCELAGARKVPAQNAVISNAKAITYLVTSVYGSEIAGTGKLEASQIVNGTIVQIVGRVKQGCYAKITDADKKFVDEVIAQFTAHRLTSSNRRSRR